ncbi:hypothetical protein COCOR_07797 [Corallococcus coralloides DSM 2259]|uniref:YokE-like PH domain-containing protein n=1 Tax=Corallococcus coralloides (strain ATCC 25202 / DSM 2259 / NBRC 100086 / M2) TaxID=1144275 RepID=H8MUS2_CORCM|nr:hypothetical protein [Corallococcus coralloides]AFE07746.1 hypothetical protein COCOR_07797 [Corallococcus coralloides DSM 2259]
MTALSAESRLRRLLRVFSQTGGEGQWTRPFDNLPVETRAYLLERAALAADELPVLAFFRGPEQWVLVSTERILLSQEHGFRSIPWRDLENATTDTAHVQAAGSKLSLSRLRLQLRDAADLEVDVEPGPPFFGLWNVLKTLAVLRRE